MGRILYEDTAFATIDIEKAYAEVERYAKPRVRGEII